MSTNETAIPITITDTDQCPDRRKHTSHPRGYLAYDAWAEKKLRTHRSTQCPTCGLWAIWKRREKPLTKAEVEEILFPETVPTDG